MNSPAPPPTPSQVALVQRSAQRLAPNMELFAAAFYTRLFELDPDLRRLFSGNLVAQGHKFAKMLGFLTANLKDADALGDAVRDMGARHHTYGVTDAHYAIVGEALLWTLGHLLGDELTPPVRAAWASTYSFIAATMIQGALAVGHEQPPASREGG